MKKILIANGIHNRDWILPHYLQHIYNLNYDKKLIDIYWIINNCLPTDTSAQILQEFQEKHKDEYNSIYIEIINSKDKVKDERTSNIRETFTYKWLSYIRNLLLDKCVELDCDYFANIDCDILVPPNLLLDLVGTNQKISASLIYNGYLYAPPNVDKSYDPVANAYKFPNILKRNANGSYTHIANYYTKNPDKTPKNKLIEVDATGACCLISKDVCANTRYGVHKQGEDMGWAEDCISKGYKMYCLPSCYSQHIMSRDLLEMYLNNKLGVNGGNT